MRGRITRRRFITGALAAALVLSLPASSALADKTITAKTLTLADVTSITFTRRDASTWLGGATYTVKNSTGATVNTGSIAVTLNAAQKTAVENFITTHLLGPANAQEGL